MTTDIDGGLEIRSGGPSTPWRAVKLEVLLASDYDAFGCLFGVRNYAGFVPVAAGRGLPADVSTELRRRALEEGVHDHTWIDCHELGQVDWDEPAATVDMRIHKYRITDSCLVPSGKAAWSAAWQGVAGPAADPDGRAHPEGAEWKRGDLSGGLNVCTAVTCWTASCANFSTACEAWVRSTARPTRAGWSGSRAEPAP